MDALITRNSDALVPLNTDLSIQDLRNRLGLVAALHYQTINVSLLEIVTGVLALLPPHRSEMTELSSFLVQASRVTFQWQQDELQQVRVSQNGN